MLRITHKTKTGDFLSTLWYMMNVAIGWVVSPIVVVHRNLKSFCQSYQGSLGVWVALSLVKHDVATSQGCHMDIANCVTCKSKKVSGFRRCFWSVEIPLFPTFCTPFPFLFPTLTIHSRKREREYKFAFPNFGNGNEKLHSQLLGTGTGMKKSFPIFGNGNGRPVFPGMAGNGNSRSPLAYIEVAFQCNCHHGEGAARISNLEGHW